MDDDEDVLSAARLFLKRHVLQVDTETDPNHLPRLMVRENYDVILLDMNFTQDVNSGHEGFYWLDRILEIDPTAVVVLITAYGGIELAVKAIKEGATDFVVKPWENEKLLATLLSAMKLKASRKEVYDLRSRQKAINASENSRFQDIVGQSEVMQKIFDTIEMVAETDANVLILGENGTGKELIARAIHRNSNRKEEVFINVDLGAISESLFESELFGHVKGAFTDAKEDKIGRFEMANGGTLFLDEIGNLPLNLQAKLLTVLQEKKIVRLGEGIQRSVDVRLIFATNAPLKQWVNDGKFRQDLLFRINTIEIEIPPLRHRSDDIPLFIDHFLKQFSLKYKKGDLNISPEAKATLMSHSWPGNIREMQHIMERGVIMSNGAEIKQSDFNLSLQETPNAINIDDKDNLNLQEIEIMLIQKAIAKHQGNISKAAKELGLTRAALYRRMEKFNL